MKERPVLAAAVFFASSLLWSASPDSDGTTDRRFQGRVTDTHCGRSHPEGDQAADCVRECVRNGLGQYALFVPSEGKTYIMDNQDEVGLYSGQRVVVKGQLEDETIKVSSIAKEQESGPGTRRR
jgi:hypothetical protein